MRSETTVREPAAADISRRTFALTGVALAVSFAGWTVLAAVLAGARSWAMGGLVLAVALAVAAGRLIAGTHAWIVPLAVALSPLLVALITRSPLLGDGPLGYANASGALFFVAACAAALVAMSARSMAVRLLACTVTGIWVIIPWRLDADAATVTAALLLMALLVPWHQSKGRAILGAGLAAAGSALLCTIGVAASGYDPGGDNSLAGRWFSANLHDLRATLWSDAVGMGISQPLTGVGPGMFRDVNLQTRTHDAAAWAHSEYLQVFAETGIPGVVLLFGLLAWCAALLWRSGGTVRAVPAILAFAGVLMLASIDYIWHFPEVPVAVALLLGASSVRLRIEEGDAKGGAVVGALVSATVLVCVALLLPIPVINPAPTAANEATWLEDGGLAFAGRGIARSTGSMAGAYRRIQESQTLTIEAWVKSAVRHQYGPARIVSSSGDTSARNFTIGQEHDGLALRLRTTQTNRNGTDGEIVVADVFATTELRHVVLSAGPAEVDVYIDGRLHWRGAGPGGTLENWVEAFPLLLGNEGSGDRPWSGIIYSLALYDHRFSSSDARRAYGSGDPAESFRVASAASPLALYAFRPDERGVAANQIGREPGVFIPARFDAPVENLARTFFEPGAVSGGSVLAHAILFSGWTVALILVAGRSVRGRREVLVVIGCGLLLAAAVVGLRYAGGYGSSAGDIIAAVAGCGVGVLAGRKAPGRPDSRRTTVTLHAAGPETFPETSGEAAGARQ